MGYTKLFSSLIHSTIWREADHVRIVWITLLVMSDKDGVVECSVPGLADAARVTIQQCVQALDRLQNPDIFSRNTKNEGRRIEKIDGGFEILNFEYYRRKSSDEERRERNADKQRRWRERQKSNNSNPVLPTVTDSNPALPVVTEITPQTRSDQTKPEQNKPDTDKDTRPTRERVIDVDFDLFWKVYPKKVGKKAALKALQQALKTGCPSVEVMIAAIDRQCKSDQWRRDGGQYIPNPATWINQGRWDDDLPEGPGRKLLPQEQTAIMLQEWLAEENEKNGSCIDCEVLTADSRILPGEVDTVEADGLGVEGTPRGR